MSSILVLLILLFSSFEASDSISVGSRSILRAINNKDGEKHDFAVDLNATSFDAVLRETPATYAIVEFFAHWNEESHNLCKTLPYANEKKAQYEKVARLFNGADAVHPGLILMTRVDCASKGKTILITNDEEKKACACCDVMPISVSSTPVPAPSVAVRVVFGLGSLFLSYSLVIRPLLLTCLAAQDKSELRPIDDGRTADHLLNWINKQMGSYEVSERNERQNSGGPWTMDEMVLRKVSPKCLVKKMEGVYGKARKEITRNTAHSLCITGEISSPRLASRLGERLGELFKTLMKTCEPSPNSYGLDDEKYENELLQTNVSDPGQIARAVYDVEEATSTAFDIILGHKMIKLETRASLIKFLQLLVAHHPSRRCRRGSAEILVNFDDLCPSDMMLDNKHESVISCGNRTLGNSHICGKEVPRGYWMFCRGSKNDTRGFSCGLWVLLHSLSVRMDDGESHLAFGAICDFIHNFFICEECCQHFYEMCSSVSSPFNKTRDFVLWLWSAHNKVNERLMKEEASLGTGDPKFPKIIWPSRQLCPSCYLAESRKGNGNSQIDWDHDEVFKLLTSYYGKMLVTLTKDKGLLAEGGSSRALAEEAIASTHAIVVPVGAAFAIAVASCAFGALACFWRSRQKNRKYLHQLHSLKNI
ncbi:unnamed protein product [Ilex paraguariensis]|uniref:Sulfhydryl oxidase n=1 Tax=Ilex paraguariensis TaxID=185542 RepID=A0ABC8R8I1_9AQUA